MKNNIRFLLAFAFLPICMWGNIGPQGFHQYKRRVFIETGCYMGNGIQKALEAGFSVIYSLDISPHFVQHCQNRFRNNSNVHVLLKDTRTHLQDVLVDIHEPVTFWLDAHNGSPDPKAIGVSNTPLMEELEQIKRHPIKTHTILIDDLHCCGRIYFDYLSLEDIKAKVLEINPHYTITFVAGGDRGEYPNNVLVAYIPTK